VAQELVHLVLSAVPDDVTPEAIFNYLTSLEGRDREVFMMALEVGWPKLAEAVSPFLS
jgi:hypothetical protein